MPRQYIDPQPLKDEIEALKAENAELKAKLAATTEGKDEALQLLANKGARIIDEGMIKSKLEAAEAAIKLAEEAFPALPNGLTTQSGRWEPEAAIKLADDALGQVPPGDPTSPMSPEQNQKWMDAITEMAAKPVVFETKTYSDGSSATGVAPLPELSPEQQDERDKK